VEDAQDAHARHLHLLLPGPPVHARGVPRGAEEDGEGLTALARRRRDILVAAAGSRALVLAVAMITAGALSVSTADDAPRGKVVPGVTHPFGGFGSGILDAIFSPLVRWDAPWYLVISHDGYDPPGLGVAGNEGQRAAFFPFYPALIHALGGFLGNGITLVVATLISLAAFMVGLAFVHRLAERELGPAAAHAAVLVIALWPAGPFFSAPYTESLFLMLSAGAFLAARDGRWALAGIAAALAAATRNTGILLVVPLAILWWQAGPRRPADLAWLALTPLGLIAFSLLLQAQVDDWQAWRHAQESFGRSGLAGPWTTIRLALSGAYHEVRDGHPGPNVLDLVMFIIFCVGLVGMWRRLPKAYVAWAFVAIAPALVAPFGGEALRSLPRFLSVSFPLAIWLGDELTRRRLLTPWLLASTALLVYTTVAFTRWLPYV
jgi:Mannosyltransferase (PIG-V)